MASISRASLRQAAREDARSRRVRYAIYLLAAGLLIWYLTTQIIDVVNASHAFQEYTVERELDRIEFPQQATMCVLGNFSTDAGGKVGGFSCTMSNGMQFQNQTPCTLQPLPSEQVRQFPCFPACYTCVRMIAPPQYAYLDTYVVFEGYGFETVPGSRYETTYSFYIPPPKDMYSEQLIGAQSILAGTESMILYRQQRGTGGSVGHSIVQNDVLALSPSAQPRGSAGVALFFPANLIETVFVRVQPTRWSGILGTVAGFTTGVFTALIFLVGPGEYRPDGFLHRIGVLRYQRGDEERGKALL